MSGEKKEKLSSDNWDKKESPVKFIVQIVVAAVILSGIYVWYRGDVEKSQAADAHAMEARDLILLGNPQDYEKAIKKLEEALALKGNHPYALATLAELHAILWGEHKMAGHDAKAREYLAGAERHAPNLAQTFSAKALLMIYGGQAKEAEDYLRENVIDKDAGDARILAAYGMAQRAQGKLDDARRALRAGFDLDWRDPRFAQLIGDSYLETGDAANALNYYQRGVGANSEHLGNKMGMLRARIASANPPGDAETQIKEAKEMMGSPRVQALVRVTEAEFLVGQGKLDEAAEAANAAVQADATYPWSYATLASIHARKGEFEETAKQYEKAIEADAYIGAFYFAAASTLAQAENADGAIAFMEKYPLKRDDRFLVNYGNMLQMLGRLDDALARYDEAIEANQVNADAYLGKGTVLMAQKKFDEAQDALDRGKAARQFFPELYAQRGQLLFEKKEYADGLQEYVTALQQWRQQKMDRERLLAVIENVRQTLVQAGQRNYARAWAEEAPNFIR